MLIICLHWLISKFHQKSLSNLQLYHISLGISKMLLIYFALKCVNQMPNLNSK